MSWRNEPCQIFFPEREGWKTAFKKISGSLFTAIPKLPGPLCKSGVGIFHIHSRLEGAWFENTFREVDRTSCWESTLVLGNGIWVSLDVYTAFGGRERSQQIAAGQSEDGKNQGYNSHCCGDFQQYFIWVPRIIKDFTMRLRVSRLSQSYNTVPQTIPETMVKDNCGLTRAATLWTIYLNNSDLGNGPLEKRDQSHG